MATWTQRIQRETAIGKAEADFAPPACWERGSTFPLVSVPRAPSLSLLLPCVQGHSGAGRGAEQGRQRWVRNEGPPGDGRGRIGVMLGRLYEAELGATRSTISSSASVVYLPRRGLWLWVWHLASLSALSRADAHTRTEEKSLRSQQPGAWAKETASHAAEATSAPLPSAWHVRLQHLAHGFHTRRIGLPSHSRQHAFRFVFSGAAHFALSPHWDGGHRMHTRRSWGSGCAIPMWPMAVATVELAWVREAAEPRTRPSARLGWPGNTRRAVYTGVCVWGRLWRRGGGRSCTSLLRIRLHPPYIHASGFC